MFTIWTVYPKLCKCFHCCVMTEIAFRTGVVPMPSWDE